MAPLATTFDLDAFYRARSLGQRVTTTPMKLVPAHYPVLHKKAKLVETPEEMEYVLSINREMIDKMMGYGGCGLAAPQVGISLRFFVMCSGDHGFLTCINPEIIEHGAQKKEHGEGCLSMPGFEKTVARWRVITVKFLSAHGPMQIVLKGMDARCFQHELDHLDGICIFPQPAEPAKQ